MAADSSTKQQVESPLAALVRVRKEAQQAVARFHAEVEADRLAIGKLLSEPTDTEAHKPESRPKERRKDDPVRVALETGAQAGNDENFPKPTDPDTKGAEASAPDISGVSKSADRVGRKLLNPAAYPVMSVKEVATAFQKSVSTIYRWVEIGKLSWSGVHGRIPTESVKRLLGEKPTE